jgi:hypothetical protein
VRNSDNGEAGPHGTTTSSSRGARRRWIHSDANPVAAYTLAGVVAAIIFLLCAGAIVMAVYLTAKASDDFSGAGGVIGFMIVPLVVLVGAPWSLVMLSSNSTPLIVAGVVAGPIINGAIVGAIRGYFVERRRNREFT